MGRQLSPKLRRGHLVPPSHSHLRKKAVISRGILQTKQFSASSSISRVRSLVTVVKKLQAFRLLNAWGGEKFAVRAEFCARAASRGLHLGVSPALFSAHKEFSRGHIWNNTDIPHADANKVFQLLNGRIMTSGDSDWLAVEYRELEAVSHSRG